uniref:Uncharacterized protein n=1 Tax=Arundo donax TaxID=35708 RepID=A0A0A9A1M0_ARUDO
MIFCAGTASPQRPKHSYRAESEFRALKFIFLMHSPYQFTSQCTSSCQT